MLPLTPLALTELTLPVAEEQLQGLAMILLSSFVFGIIFGSFLNSAIYRLKNGRRFGGRSFCPKCKAKLKWYDLIPILSFVYLRGYCRYCHKKISWQYPIVELLSGFLWLAIFYKNEFSGNFQFFLPAEALTQAGIFNFQLISVFYQILIFSALLVIAVYDFNWQIIPDEIIYPAIIAALVFNILNFVKIENLTIFIPTIIVASGAFLFFFLIYFFSKGRAMGFGDGKLAFLIGLFLGPLLAITALNLAFITGAIYGIILLSTGQKTLKSQIPFGPFLVFGTGAAFFLSNFINNLIVF